MVPIDQSIYDLFFDGNKDLQYNKISISDMCTPKPDSIISVPSYKNFGFKRSPNSRLDSVSVSDFVRAYQIAQSKIYFFRTSCEIAGPGCSVQVFYRSVIRASNPLKAVN